MFFLTLSQWFLEKIYLDSSASVVIETLSMNYKDNDVLEYFRTSVSGKGFQRCIQNLAKNITGAFSKIVNGFQQLTISAESSILDV